MLTLTDSSPKTLRTAGSIVCPSGYFFPVFVIGTPKSDILSESNSTCNRSEENHRQAPPSLQTHTFGVKPVYDENRYRVELHLRRIK